MSDELERGQKLIKEKKGDNLTRGLLSYFGVINNGKYVEVPHYGEMREDVVLAALRWGKKQGEIKIGWVEQKGRVEVKPAEVTLVSESGLRVVKIVFEKKLYKSIEGEIEAMMPKGVMPVLAKDQADVVAVVAKKMRKSREEITKEWETLRQAIGEAYHLYREFAG